MTARFTVLRDPDDWFYYIVDGETGERGAHPYPLKITAERRAAQLCADPDAPELWSL